MWGFLNQDQSIKAETKLTKYKWAAEVITRTWVKDSFEETETFGSGLSSAIKVQSVLRKTLFTVMEVSWKQSLSITIAWNA